MRAICRGTLLFVLFLAGALTQIACGVVEDGFSDEEISSQGQATLAARSGDVAWEVSAAPLLGRDKALYGQLFLGDGSSSFARMGGSDGSVKWSHPVSEHESSLDGRCLYRDALVIADGTLLLGLEPQTGAEIWSRGVDSDEPLQPACPDAGDVLYVQAGTVDAATETWRPKLLAIRRSNGSVAWKIQVTPTSKTATATLSLVGADESRAIILRDAGTGPSLQARSSQSGGLLWSRRLAASAVPSIDVRGRIFITQHDDAAQPTQVRRIDADSGATLWSRGYAGQNVQLVLSGATALITSDEWVRSIRPSDGSDLWKRSASGYGVEPVTIGDGRLVLTSISADETACKVVMMATSSAPAWQRTFAAPCETIADANDRLFVFSGNTIRYLNSENGAVRWRYKDDSLTARGRLSSRVASDTSCVFGSWLEGAHPVSAGAFALDLATGASRWRTGVIGNGVYFVKSTPARAILGIQHYRSHPTTMAFEK